MKILVLSAAALMLLSTYPGMAQSGRSEVRESRQKERIYKGAARGELTPSQLRALAYQQRKIDRAQSRAARDGVITRAERRELQRMQDRASRSIYRKNHNNRAISGGY